MADSPIRQTIFLAPTETVEFFRAKGDYPISRRWWEVWQEEHARSFTIAGVTDRAVLEQVRATLDTVLSKGGTFEMWKKDTLASLRAAVDAGAAPANILSDARLRTIYQTNLRMARAAGQWKRIQASKDVMPFLKYSAIDDDRTRPLHRIWGGLDGGTAILLPVDHPAWEYLYPPNGWGCRCNIIQLSARDLRDRDLSITSEAELRALGLPTADMTPEEVSAISQEFIRGDGVIEEVPAGIDPGFAYNVGKEHFRGLSQSLTASLAAVATVSVPTARAILEDHIERSIWTAFLETPGSAYPVMVLDDAQRVMMRADPRIVLMSSDTYAKQLANHAELTIDDYRRLLDLASSAEIYFDQGQRHTIVVKKAGPGKWLKAVVKITENGKEAYVVSFQLADDRELRRLRRRYREVRSDG